MDKNGLDTALTAQRQFFNNSDIALAVNEDRAISFKSGQTRKED